MEAVGQEAGVALSSGSTALVTASLWMRCTFPHTTGFGCHLPLVLPLLWAVQGGSTVLRLSAED